MLSLTLNKLSVSVKHCQIGCLTGHFQRIICAKSKQKVLKKTPFEEGKKKNMFCKLWCIVCIAMYESLN